jgi:hypothetical protein
MKHAATQEFTRQWGVRDVPTAEVAHGKLFLDEYPMFALLAWVQQRKATWPVVGLRLSVLTKESDRVIGGLTMGMPLTPNSERHVSRILEELGWDGRIWPHKDHEWPEGTEDEPGLLTLLRTAKLGATLTFPPQPEGTPTVTIPVLKRSGVYSVAPFSEGPVVPRHLETLRSLAANPTPFKSDWETARRGESPQQAK